MKIAFFGTPEFAGEIFSGILEYPEIDCRLVVSQPDKKVGRKKELLATPVKQVALDAGIEVMQPQYLSRTLSCKERDLAARDFQEYLSSLDLDFIVVVAYGKIIPKAILNIPKHGCINLHGSILPKYRGASPVQAAVKDGLKETGLTTMYMSEGMDEGDILLVQKVVIDNIDRSPDVFKKFVQIGPTLLRETLQKASSGELIGIPQDHQEASYCGKISREDGEVSFSQQSSKDIYNTFRAYSPWPGIYTWYEGKRLVLEEISIYTGDEEIFGKPGEFIPLSKNTYGIICADNKILEIQRVKLEGKKSMDTRSFVNGNSEVVGYKFT